MRLDVKRGQWGAWGLAAAAGLLACKPPEPMAGFRPGPEARSSSGSKGVESQPTVYTRREVGALVYEGVPEIPPAVKDGLREYTNIRAARYMGWSDRGPLLRTRFGEGAQVHRVRRPGGMREQLTFVDEPVAWVSVSPRGDRFAYGTDTGGDESYQGYLYDLGSGEVVRYTEAGTRNGGPVWSPDGAALSWYRAKQTEADWDILTAQVSDPVATRRVVHEGTGAVFPVSFSPSKSRLLVGRYTSIVKSERFLLDLQSGELRPVDLGRSVAWAGGTLIDNRRFVAVTDFDSEFRRLVMVDATSGRVEVLSEGIAWDVERFDVSPKRRRVAYAVNAGGRSEVYTLDLKSRRRQRGPDLGMAVATGLGFSPSGEEVGVSFSGSSSPGDVWSFSVRGPQVSRWTESEVGGLDRDSFVEPELIEVKSGTITVSAFVYRPSAGGPRAPVVIDIHGGPEGQERPYFSATIQHWVEKLGLCVVAPNVRGSSGYGKRFVRLDDGLNRMKSVADIGRILDWVGEQPDLDPEKVVVYGGSYGGFMVLASMIEFGERLAGGVDIVGISDFETFLKNTKGYRRDLRRAEYGDERDPTIRAFFRKISPLRRAGEIRKPLFVVQGLNDPRVPASEAEQILGAVRDSGGSAWYLLAKDEGHGFRKKSNRAALRAAVTVFLADVLDLKL